MLIFVAGVDGKFNSVCYKTDRRLYKRYECKRHGEKIWERNLLFPFIARLIVFPIFKSYINVGSDFLVRFLKRNYRYSKLFSSTHKDESLSLWNDCHLNGRSSLIKSFDSRIMQLTLEKIQLSLSTHVLLVSNKLNFFLIAFSLNNSHHDQADRPWSYYFQIVPSNACINSYFRTV